MIAIDGSFGEGGGQILRSALALSMVTGQPFQIDNIRAGRQKPGLMRQHLTAVRAAAEVCGAEMIGATMRSTALEFRPGRVSGGEYHFSIGTAGSTTLVLQTILLPLVMANTSSRIVLEGGTHNPFAPPFDFLEKAYIPLINRMGPTVTATLERSGYYPAGGGKIVIEIEPAERLEGFELLTRGELIHQQARASIAKLDHSIANRELRVIGQRLGWDNGDMIVDDVIDSAGPGNIVVIELAYDHVTELFTGFGEIKRSAEAVATHAVQLCQRYMKSSAPVGEYLTDQLLLPMAIAGGGAFVSTGLTQHATTHIELIRQFLDVPISTDHDSTDGVLIRYE